VESKESELVPALGRALGDFIRGAIGDVYFQHSGQDLAAAFVNVFINAVKANFATSIQWTHDVAANIVNSFITAVRTNFGASVDWLKSTIDTYIIQPIKDILGISSPSTVFAGIGRDIVLGLISGWSTAIGSFLSVVRGFIETVLDLFSPILDLFNIDLSFGGGSTGTTGGGAGDTTHPRDGGTLTGTSSVVNNFYGTVIFGDMGQLGYDCPSPHPLVAASSQSLLTSAIG
jgi:hypothetical protein